MGDDLLYKYFIVLLSMNIMLLPVYTNAVETL